MVNNRAAARKLATGMRYITQICNDQARIPNDEASKEPNACVDLFVIRASTLIRHSSFGFRHFIRCACNFFDTKASTPASLARCSWL
jgi:hypothetical protein